jgi:hypothetical protein
MTAEVEITFAYGRADKPYIRTALSLGWDLPTIKEGETKIQTREGVISTLMKVEIVENKSDESLKEIISKLAKLECKTRTVMATIGQDHRSPKHG